jgi:pimeloyl-ACP methyl ester carboxylesterase
MKLVFLPATDPRDSSYGRPQQEWPVLRRSHPQAEVLLLSFDTMVWYTRSIRADAFDRIREICDGEFSQVVLIGFSKSGCGAMNIALDHPGLFRSVVVFDAPLLNEDINRFGMYRFYPSADQLRPDVPLLRIQNGDSYGSTELILIVGIRGGWGRRSRSPWAADRRPAQAWFAAHRTAFSIKRRKSSSQKSFWCPSEV